MNAWPIGGKDQKGSYGIGARYNAKELASRIRRIGRYRDRIIVSNEDGIKLTRKYLRRKNTFIYLDPPYFKQGAMLYLSHYQLDDHNNLAELLNLNCRKNWVLTYDERARIRDLYPKRRRLRLSLNYRIRTSRKARELMILSDPASRNI
jgi:DNA adenine methylase